MDTHKITRFLTVNVIKILFIGLMIFDFFGCASRSISLQPEIKSGNPFKKQMISTSGVPLTADINDAELSKTLPEMTGDEYEHLGDALLQKGNLHIAYLQYERSLQRNPDNIRVECKKGLALLAGNQYSDAIRQFETVLKKKPGYVPAYEGLGRAYFYKKDYVEAEKYFRLAVSMDPKLWKAHNYLGNIYDFQKRYETAIGEYKSAIAVNPKAGFVYNNLGVSYSVAGKYLQAVKAFKNAIDSKYVAPKVYNNLGIALSNLKRYNEALEAFRKGGTEAQAYNNLGVVYLKQGKFEQASDYFEKAIRIDPKFYNIANENLKKAKMISGGQLNEKGETMKANIKKRIRTLSILLLSCTFIFSTGCSGLRDWWGYDASTSLVANDVFVGTDINQFYSSVRPVNGTAESDYRLARYFQKRGKHQFAVDELLNIIRKDPSFIKAYNALGVSYDHLGQFDLAVKSYKFALQLNPELGYVHNNLGYSYLLNGDLDSAIDAFQKAIAQDDTNKRYHNNLGLAYARKGQTDMAFEEFKVADAESGVKNKKVEIFKNSNTSPALKKTTVDASPEGITPYDDIPKDTAQPLLFAVSAQPVSEENPEFRLIPDDLTKIDRSEKTIEHEVKQSNLTQKTVAETKAPLSYTVQVSASKNFLDSTHVMKMLANKGYPCPYLNKVGDKNAFYRVRLGSFLDKKEADQLLSDLNQTLEKKPFIAFEDEHAKKIVLTTGKQKCFEAKNVSSTVIQLLDIEISNGNGVRHMARNVGIYLNAKGFRATRLTNAAHFNYPETKIYYQKGYRQDALRLAEDIPGPQKETNVIELNQVKGRAIKVLIGKDLVPFHAEIMGNLKSNVAKVKNPTPMKQRKVS